MTALLAVLLAGLPSEAEVTKVVQARFERLGRATPPVDPALSAAAREVARLALDAGVDLAAGPVAVTRAVSRHEGWDPTPVVVLQKGSPAALLPALESYPLGEEPVSLLGVGVAGGENGGAVAVLLARRRVELERFPRLLSAPSGRPQRLCGQLRPPLASAQVFVTRPGGEVLQVEMRAQGPRRCATLSFPTAGRHAVEVLGAGPRGPEVAALFFVDVGAVPEGAEEGLGPEPASDAEARQALTARVNRLRQSQGAAPLEEDPVLDRVAQAWASRLASEGFFAHVGPDGSDLQRRLAAAGYGYSAAGENLGVAAGPLAAHFGIEHSPGHRRNLLQPEHRALGLGLARRPDGLTVLVEVLARPQAAAGAAPTPAEPLEEAYQALRAQRLKAGLGPLATSPVLEALAQEHARAALAAGLARTQLPGRPRLQDRVFAALEEAGSVSVDLFVAETPRGIAGSQSARAAGNTLVGVGLVREDLAPRGKGRYWIVVIYAGPR